MRAERFPWRRLGGARANTVSVAAVLFSACVFTGALVTVLRESEAAADSATLRTIDDPGPLPGDGAVGKASGPLDSATVCPPVDASHSACPVVALP